jgi:alpha-N-arabinofuranosidase
MASASLVLDPAFTIASVSRKLFGGFVEQMGRGVYGGLYEPGHPSADARGFRTDVADLVRELGISTVRYPGGNFVSNYRWEDGIGPVDDRAPRLDLAWRALEPNTFGLDEFIAWCRTVEAEPMMAINLGTRGIQEALDLLEYCNVPGGTRLSDQRRRNGSPDPHDIRIWCLGNEMDGPWQIGRKTAFEYGRLAAETGRAMLAMDPDLQLVACGSSGSDMPWFGEWERVVLAEAYDQVDYISAHAYYWEDEGDLPSFLGSSVHFENYIRDVISTADHVRASLKSKKRINVSVDEWNVWYQKRHRPVPSAWKIGEPRLEDDYDVADAVVVGSMLISLLRNSDRVHSASLAQLVNVIAPIRTEPNGPAWKQTIFHPFAQASRYARGVVLGTPVASTMHDTMKHGDVADVDAVATWNEDTREVTIFLVNTTADEDAGVTVDLRSLPVDRILEASQLWDIDPDRRATVEAAVEPSVNTSVRFEGRQLHVTLPATSWNMVRLGGA